MYDNDNQNLGRGGRIVRAENEAQKFAKIGITDKYEIEAMTDIGLSGVKFTKEGVEQTIKNAYENLASSIEDYTISEVSNAIINIIVNEKNVRLRQGDSIENIKRYDALIDDENAHKEYVDEFKKTQLSGLNEWVSYLNQSEYPYAFRYLMLKAVLNDNYDFKQNALQKRNKKTIRNFTPFDAGTLAEVYSIKSDYLLRDYTLKQLENADKIVRAREIAKTSGGGKWIKFNGGSNTPEEERGANASDLSSLVQDTYWCTKTNAKGQLDGGDFYVYVTEKDGKKYPRIAIRMEGERVGEVRGNASAAQDLEPEMNPIAEQFLLNNLDEESGKKWLDSIRYNQRAYDLYLEVLDKDIYEGFIEAFIDLKKDEKAYLVDYAIRNGHIQRLEKYIKENYVEIEELYGVGVLTFSIENFDPSTTKFFIGDAIFRETNLKSLGKLQHITGNAVFSYSEVEDLGNLQTIGGNGVFSSSRIKSLLNLQKIGGYGYFNHSQVKSLGNLMEIGDFADFEKSLVRNLGNLTTIGDSAMFLDSEIENLGNLKTIGGDAIFRGSKIKSLGNLQTINGNANFSGSQVKSLSNLIKIGGSAVFFDCEIESLGKLETIGKVAKFSNSKIKDLGNLHTIFGTADFRDTKIKDLGNLKNIMGAALLMDSEIEDLKNLEFIGSHFVIGNEIRSLGKLEKIGGDGNFKYNEKLKSLGNLQSIGGDANFSETKLESLGSLNNIERNAYFFESQVRSLGDLQRIGGHADFHRSKVEDLGNLHNIEGNAYFNGSQVRSLGNLQTIGRNVDFGDTQIESLGNLHTIRGNAYFGKSQVRDLGNLKTIRGNVYFENSRIKSLGNLTTIRGYANFENSQVQDLGNLETIGGSINWGNRTDLQAEWESGENKNLGRGGRIVQAENEAQKFAKIGITDKYEIEAMTDIGLSGVKFTKEGVEQAIKTAYENLALSIEDYTISEVSNAIINVIINEKNVSLRQGDSVENIKRLEDSVEDSNAHKEYVEKFKKTQLSGLNEWVSYLNQSGYPYAFRYLMLKAVLNDNYDFKQDALQKRNKKTIRNFTPFDSRTLAEVYSIKSNYLLKDYTLKQIESADKIVASKQIAKTKEGGTWVKFNGSYKTPETERWKNAGELSSLVQDTYWCTKTNAKSQLDGGDFYVYVTEKDGKYFPRIAIRMSYDKVGEVRGNASSAQDLEPEMNPIAEDFLLNNLDKESGKKWLDSIRYNDSAYALYLKALEGDIHKGFIDDFIALKENEKANLYDYAERNGHIQRIEKYLYGNPPEIEAVYGKNAVIMSAQGFDPKRTKIILGDANFEDSNLKSLGELKLILGDGYFSNSKIENLGNLEKIGGKAIFRLSKVKSLGNLKSIGSNAIFFKSEILDLGALSIIGGDADFDNSVMVNLGSLRRIGGNGFFANSQVKSLENLETIGGSAYFSFSKLENLGSLFLINKNAFFEGSQISDLGNLNTIGGNADFFLSKVFSLGNLETIGGDVNFEDSKIENLGRLQTIKGKIKWGNRKDLKAEWKSRENKMRMGGRLNPSKTPAPIKERIYGSKTNKPNSSASLKSASAIKLSPENISTLNKKVLEFKKKYTNRNKNMSLNALKAVMRRGMGAYSSTHRPTISGGKPNSRVAWGLARVNAFLFKAENGRPKNPKYVQDDDLLRELGYKFAMQMGGSIYLPELYDFDEIELKKGGEIAPKNLELPNKEVLEYGDFLKKNYPKVWKAGGNIFGNQAFENLKRVSNRGYWLESERWMYEKWQSFVKRHQHNHLLAGVVANIKWASWGNIGKTKAKSVIENAF